MPEAKRQRAPYLPQGLPPHVCDEACGIYYEPGCPAWFGLAADMRPGLTQCPRCKGTRMHGQPCQGCLRKGTRG